MRASVLYGIKDLRLDERPVPSPGRGEVLVRVSAVGVCGSDIHYYERGRIGRYVVREPLVLGHEASGVVEAVGAGVADHQPGQRVSLEPGVPCRNCCQCVSGRYNLCQQVQFLATPPVDGALAEFVVVPSAFAHPVPDSLSDDAAALIEPLSVGVWACRKAAVGPGSRVLVTGAGPIGLLTAQVAKASGASEVTVTDVISTRLEVARGLGMGAVDASGSALEEAGLEPDTLLECSGSALATTGALGYLAPAGRAVLVGMGADELVLSLSTIQERELTVTGAFRYAGTWPAAIALATSGAVDLDAVVTGHYPLDRVAEALTASRRDPLTIKAIVTPGG
jgi:L-iditol 2-dehydrogenase